MDTQQTPTPPPVDPRRVSRRAFLTQSGLLAAAGALLGSRSPLLAAGAATGAREVVRDTMNGLVAFLVPGPDPYSVVQGASTPEPGGIDANVTTALIESLDDAAPYMPQFSAFVAGILDNVASLVDPVGNGNFESAFARLSVRNKAVVFSLLEQDPQARALFGIVPALVAFLAYSEVGVFDPVTRQLTGRPVGWTITGYEGVADGRPEFQGYFEGRRQVS